MNEENLHGYQNTSVRHIIENPYSGLFLDMGLGKTVSTLTAVNKLMFEELDINRVLVIAPKRVVESVWSAEAKKWDHLKHLGITKIIGTAAQRAKALNQKSDIFLLGRDNVVWLLDLLGTNELPFDMLVIDESSSFKSHKSKRFKALKKVQPLFSRVLLLTGTPAPNGLIDLWAQIFLLDRGERLERSRTRFLNTYYTPGKRNGHIIYSYDLRPNSERLIHEKVSDLCISMKAKDYLTLPERIDNFIEIEMPPGIEKQYKEFEREQVLEMFPSEADISALNAAALTNKLLQYANGAVYDSEGEYHELHKLKLEALDEIMEASNGKPVLVAYSYRHDLERIIERLKKYSPVKLGGDEDVIEWNKGNIRVLVMHPASGGHGLNLQSGGNIIVWFGQPWSLELYMQLNARLHRQGQKDKVTIHHIVLKGTMDNDVRKSIANKEVNQESLMLAVKAKVNKYVQNF